VIARTTVALGAGALVLAAGVAGEAWYLWGTSDPSPSATRPVVIGDIDAQTAVDTAATDAAAIFSTSWHAYDAHLARVTSVMTDDMADRARTRSAWVRYRSAMSSVITDVTRAR